jgi:hypothetical protein
VEDAGGTLNPPSRRPAWVAGQWAAPRRCIEFEGR